MSESPEQVDQIIENGINIACQDIIQIDDLSKCLTIDGNVVTYGILGNQVYVNLTDLCKAGGKLYGNWRHLKSTQAFLNALESKLNNHNLVISIMHGNNKNRATWGHPHVAIDIACWISPLFKIQVIDWIYTLIGLEKCFQTLDECVKNQPKKSISGYVYCITSAVLKEDTYKIGRTKQYKEDLKKAYNRAYGEYTEVILYKKVNDRYEAENFIHRELSAHKIGNSELFNCSLHIIENAFNKLN
jgi:hypothetical protein